LVLQRKLNLRQLLLLHIRDITNSTYICNTLQYTKTDILYSWTCHNSLCHRDVSAQMRERASRPRRCLSGKAGVLGASVRKGAPVLSKGAFARTPFSPIYFLPFLLRSFPFPSFTRLEVYPQIQLRDLDSAVNGPSGEDHIFSHQSCSLDSKYTKIRFRPNLRCIFGGFGAQGT